VNLLLLVVGAWLSGLGGQTMVDPVFCAGCEAVTQNPGVLAIPVGPPASFNWIAARLRLESNSFTFGDYNRYFARPTFITAADETAILGRLAAGPLEFGVRSDVEILHAHWRWFGAGISYDWQVDQSIPPEFFRLVLEGNELNRRYDLSGFSTDSLALIRIGGAGGVPVGELVGLGIGVSWLHGFNYVHTTTSSGELLTTPYAVTGYMAQTRTQADAGDGFAATLGALVRPASWLRLGLTLRDLPAAVHWNHNTGVRRFRIELDSLDAARYRLKPKLDSFIERTNSFEPGPDFWTTLPGIAAIGVGYEPNAVVRFGAVANLRLWADPFVPEPPLAALRVDLHPVRPFQLSIMPGWHRDKGPGGHLGLGFHYHGVVLCLDAEAWGLPETSEALFRLRLGFDFAENPAEG